MILAVTESNAWEREKWTYVLDIDKQDSEALNHLIIFINHANEYFEKAKKEDEKTTPPVPFHPIFNPHPIRVFAASKYWLKFYEELDMSGKYPRLRGSNDGSSLVVNSNPGYNSHSFDTSMVISPRRMKSAMQKMRDKRENILYKNFDSLFLAQKSPQKTSPNNG